MKTISTTAIVALMTATLGLSAVAPVFAQDSAPVAQAQQAERGKGGDRSFRPGAEGPRQNGGPINLLNFERGSEAIEVALVRLSHQIDLTDAQKTLLDTLKTSALSAAQSFSAATEVLRPTPPAQGQTAQRPDASERLDTRIAIGKAQLAALEAVQPAFDAFFGSLTDEQKAKLTPERGERGPGQGQFGNRDGGPGRPDGQRPAFGQRNG